MAFVVGFLYFKDSKLIDLILFFLSVSKVSCEIFVTHIFVFVRSCRLFRVLEKIEAIQWSGRRDSNPRLQPWQGCALPLSYARLKLQLPFCIYKSIFEKIIHLNLFLYTRSTSNIWGRVNAASPMKTTLSIDSYNDKFCTK